MASSLVSLQADFFLLLDPALEVLSNSLNKYPMEFMPLVIRLATRLIDEDNKSFQSWRSDLEPDSDWPLEDFTYLRRSMNDRSDDKKEALIALLEQTVTQWVQKQEAEKVRFAIERLTYQRFVVFPTILIHALRQHVAIWSKELLDILANETLYRRISCQSEICDALKTVLPYASDEWMNQWIGSVESAQRRSQAFGRDIVAPLKFFACCREDRLPQRIRNELSDARAKEPSFENPPKPKIDEGNPERIADEHQREVLGFIRELERKSCNDRITEEDGAIANPLIAAILTGELEIEPTDDINPYVLALTLASYLIRDNRADELVKQIAEQIALKISSMEVPAYYADEPSSERHLIPDDFFARSIKILAHLIRYEPTPERCDKYLEFIRHTNGNVRSIALQYMPIQEVRMDWCCDILKDRAETERLACCINLVCNKLFDLINLFDEKFDFAIEAIGILIARLKTDLGSNLQNPNEWLKKLAEFFGSAISAPDCPKPLHDWALACARREFGHEALMWFIRGTQKGVIGRREKIAWESVRELYQTAIDHVGSQEIETVASLIASPLEDDEDSEKFEGLLPILEVLAAKANDEILFSLSDHLKPHLQRQPVACLDLFEIAISQDTKQLKKAWHGPGLGFEAAANVLKKLDPFVFKEYRERLRACVERLAELGSPIAQDHLLEIS